MMAFTPTGDTVSISVSTTSANKRVPATGNDGGKVRIANDGDSTVFVKFGNDDTLAATTSDIPILPGTAEVFVACIGKYVAAIVASDTATIYATPGD